MKEINQSEFQLFYNSPIGWLRLASSETGVTAIDFCEKKEGTDHTNELVLKAKRQLQEYFEGKRTEFDFPLKMIGTHFQINVWKELSKIPFGTTISYFELSKRVGNIKAIRAVGHANGQNPLPIVIPCHRVIGSDGRLTGYGGGLWRKQWLLNHEKALPQLELIF